MLHAVGNRMRFETVCVCDREKSEKHASRAFIGVGVEKYTPDGKVEERG